MSAQEEYVTKIPLSLQTFFWRQASPYMNPRLGKQCEASCVTLERLLVQNIQHGLSPSITSAMNTIPRWLYLKASLPYVMHCCATIIKNLKEEFTTYESKLIYTMHWLLLDAASECNVPSKDSLFSLSAIQLFVYLFAPLLNQLERQHFSLLKLQHGLKIWEAMWEFSQPQIIVMCSPVKQRVDSEQREVTEEEFLRAAQTYVYYGIERDEVTDAQQRRLNVAQATYFDVAVLQCLSNSRWPTPGVLWALNYIQRRLDGILESHQQSIAADKSRSMSMPLPIIEVSMAGSASRSSSEMQRLDMKDDGELFKPSTSHNTEETSLRNKRPRTECPNNQSAEQTNLHTGQADNPDNISSVAHSSSYDLLNVTQDALADIEEEQTERTSNKFHPLNSSLAPHVEDRDMKIAFNSASFAKEDYVPVTGMVKKSKSAAPVLKVTPPTADTDEEESSADTISRSKSEPHHLFNTPEFSDEVPGSVHYITEDGSIDYNVILKAVHIIMLNSKEHDVGVQSLKVADKLIQLICLLEEDKPTPGSPNKIGFDDETYMLLIEVVVRCVVALGCPTCSHLSTSPTSSSRYQTCMVLHSLQRICNDKFQKYFHQLAEQSPLDEIIDFFHSYMNFCTHGSTRNLSDKPSFNNSHGGYAMNFGHSISGEGHRGVEGIIVVHTLKTFVSRLSTTLTDPTKSDNVLFLNNERLYHNARKFLNYAQDVHGGTFRSVAISGLVDSAKKLKADDARRASTLTSSGLVDSAKKLKADDARRASTLTSSPVTQKEKKTTRRTSRQLSHGDSLPGRKAFSDTEVGDDSETDSKDHLMPGANTRTAKSDVEDIYTDDEDFKPKLSFQAISQATVAIVRARRKVREHIRMMSAKQANKESASGIVYRASELYSGKPSPGELKEKRMVDLYLIRSGMLRFSLLMSVSHPGSLPEPELLSSLLQLDAPVAARASLFLECAYFVNQCTQGNWPSWMQTYSATSTRSATHKRTVILQRTAAALFYRWAEAIGIKLKAVLESEESDIFSVINGSDKPGSDLSQEEDFLDEATLNPKKESKVCPHALKIIACLLVYEVTTFLREIYQHMPVVHPQHLKAWQSGRQGRRTSYAAAGAGGLRPSSPTTDREPAGYRHSVAFHRPVGYRHSLFGEPVTSARPQQRISLMGGLDSGGAFGSTTSVNSAVVDSVHRKVSTSGGIPRAKKLSATASSASTTGVLMRSTRSIKLKSTGTRSNKSSASSVPQPAEAQFADESSVFYNNSDSASPADQELYADLYDELHNKLNWLTSTIQLATVTNYICEHHDTCHRYCFTRQNRNCQLLTKALEKIYEVDVDNTNEETVTPAHPVVHADGKRPSVTRLTKSSSQILLANVMDATMGKRRSFDKGMPLNSQMHESKKVIEPPPIMAYLKKHANNLMALPLSIVMKSAAVLNEEEMASAAAVAWEFLLETDKELVATAASVLLMVAGQVPQNVQDLMLSELKHSQIENRISAVKKYYVLWTYRYQVWSRLEPGAQMWFKVMPPSIDYTLPSPPVGLPGQLVPDPPWMPLYKLKLEELAANQEGSKSLVTATNTRRKQQQEMVAKALVAEESKKREAREAFPLSSVDVSIQAAQEFTKTCQQESDDTSDDVQEPVSVKEVITAHSVFPTCICLVGLTLCEMLEDSESHAGTTVGATAESVIRRCMVEDASLFFRYLFEKLTNPERRNDMFMILRKLLIWMPNLPSNAAYILFNNLVGYALFYNRSTNSNAHICMSQAMSVMWQLVPNVQGLNFKDLKTMLKKVQSEQTLMVTAHLPSTKKIIVHGLDAAIPPQAFVVHEDTQFKLVLQESFEYFSMTEELEYYQLADAKTSHMYSMHDFIRDFYVFRRNSVPQLKLVRIHPSKSFDILQKQAMDTKFVEMCKVELAKNILKFTNQTHMENQVLFLHEEFSKQVAFPRKALETEFSYFVSTLGDEMYGTDVTHKLSWIQFLNTLFKSMPGTFGWTNELKLFLNVINGCLIVNCADHGMLRSCAAIYLNLANHFKQVFATDGFLLIMPTIIKVFNTHLSYPMVKSAIVFLHGQFYKLHRRAYLLQFLGSYEPFLSASETKEDKLVLAEQLFELLHALERQEDDVLGILHAVWHKEPIKTLDFCYDENEEYKVIDAINTMITVVAYQTESHRSTQMLIVLEAIMPWHMKSLVKQAHRHGDRDKVQAASEEIGMYGRLSQSIRALIAGSEALMKPLTAQHRLLEGVTSLSGHKKDIEESVASARNVEEGRHEQEHELELRTMRNEFRRPRDALLSVVSEFFSTCISRHEILKPSIERLRITPAYFLDSKSHERLEEVAHSLLKVGTYDAETMSCRGLQRYMQEILPEGDWSQESMKNAINIITKRLERIFVKVHKRANVRALADWDALATLLRGICLTLESQPTLHHLAHMKCLVNACISIVLEYGPGAETTTAEKWNALPNHIFCSMVAKLAAQHAAVLGETGGIEQMCGGLVPSSDRVEMMLANFVIPLCLRIGGNDREKHIVPQTDIRFILCLILSSLIPHSTFVEMLKPKHPEQAQFSIHIPHHLLPHTTPHHQQPSELLKKLALLGLRTLLVCCDAQLYHLLPLLAQSVVEIGQKSPGIETWKFFDFLVTVRTVLYPLIKPFIHSTLLTRSMISEEEISLQTDIRQKMNALPAHIHKTQLLADFANELDKHRKEHSITQGSGEMMRTASVSMGTFSKKRRFSTWRKSSLISKIHQNDQTVIPVDERPSNVVNVNTVRATINYHTTDETDSLETGFKLSRRTTSKASRYGTKNPLKCIYAPDGAKLILDKFKNAAQSQLSSISNRQHYEQLANPGRRPHSSLQLIRQPHIIMEEEPVSPSLPSPSVPLAGSTSETSNLPAQYAESMRPTHSNGAATSSSESSKSAPTIVLDGYYEENIVVSQPEVRTMPETVVSGPLCSAELEQAQVVQLDDDNENPNDGISSLPALHRQGALYQHDHHIGKEARSCHAYRLSASNESKFLKTKSLKHSIASPVQASTLVDSTINATIQSRKNQLTIETVKPEEVIIDMTPTSSVLYTRDSSKIGSGSNMSVRRLRRKGSDTAELVRNEEVLANSDSHPRIGECTTMSSETTTCTSAGSTPSAEEIPYIDNTSSSGEDT